MPCHRSPGFSIIELLISVAILGIISGGGYVTLTNARYQDELYTATRIVMNDIASAQSRALSSTNVRICDLTAGGSDVCEAAATGCVGSGPGQCAPKPPAAVGVQFTMGSGAYTVYAKTDATAADLRFVSAREAIETRSLADIGAQNVVIADYDTVPVAAETAQMNVAFLRQNGTMRINQCATCVPATEMTIHLRHAQSGRGTTVHVNAVTGRISSSL
jgi:prepilin-type N-terminal cleavage/methylation domain-containing protein